jgi:hypothetical protein
MFGEAASTLCAHIERVLPEGYGGVWEPTKILTGKGSWCLLSDPKHP